MELIGILYDVETWSDEPRDNFMSSNQYLKERSCAIFVERKRKKRRLL